MQWSKQGAHLLLQTRVKTLDGELGAVFTRWYPDMDLEVEEIPTAAYSPASLCSSQALQDHRQGQRPVTTQFDGMWASQMGSSGSTVGAWVRANQSLPPSGLRHLRSRMATVLSSGCRGRVLFAVL